MGLSSYGDIRLKNALTNYDAIVNADRARVANRTVALFDKVQLKYHKEENVLAFAAAFILLCERLNVPVQEAFTAVKNLMHDGLRPTRRDHHFDAIAFHLKEDYI